MSTNLLIGYPQITIDAASVADDSDYETDYPRENVIYGPRAKIARVEADTTKIDITFDLGSSQQKTIEFLYVARANLLKAKGSTHLFLEGSDDDSSYTFICGRDGTLQTLDLLGPRAEDALFTEELANSDDPGDLAATPTYRYWRFIGADEGAAPDTPYGFSKLMFGQWFDMGRDPVSCDLGLARGVMHREARMRFAVAWRGIPEATKDTFVQTLIRDGSTDKIERGLFLYTRDYHHILNGHRVIHGTIEDYSATPSKAEGYYDISMIFEEMI